jgi:signal transduction histidine kinase/CheY-like chemotaxis protein
MAARGAAGAPPPTLLDPAEAEQALARLASLIPVGTAVGEAQRLQLGVLHALYEARTSFIAEYASGKDLLQVACVRGRNDSRVKAVAPAEGPVGRAYSERRVVQEEAVWAAPVPGGEGVLGCLVLVGPRRRSSETFLEAVAAQVGAAWELARLRDDSARRNKDLQTAVAGLRSLERNREELLATVSHDLKNPLTTVKAYLAMLAREKLGPLTPAQRKAVQTSERNADRLLRMINDLLLISRLQSGKMELHQRPFGLKALAGDVIRALTAAAEQARVRLQIARSEEVFIRGDRERMSEAISNLVDHAVHASPPGAAVELQVSGDDSGLAQVSVRDGGPDLPAEDLEHLFDPYYRPRAPESGRRMAGLALPIVAKIVHLHGGRVEASSRPGEGTTYSMYLPLFAGAVSAAADPGAGPRPGDVLLVEDDADCREVLREVLEQEGYRVLTATSAAEARSLLAHIRPGLVLLDLRLHDEDGRTVLHLVRETEALREVAVYIISGASDVASLTAGEGKDRIDGYFEKPLNLPRLLDTVASVVRPSRGPSAGA